MDRIINWLLLLTGLGAIGCAGFLFVSGVVFWPSAMLAFACGIAVSDIAVRSLRPR